MQLHTAESHFGRVDEHVAEASLHSKFWSHRPPLVMPATVADGVSIPVIVNDGRWLVQCPTCRSAQFASHRDRRFYCGECSNVAFGGQWVGVEWPSEYDAIDRILANRPAIHRHWRPNETLAVLILESDRNGSPVPSDVRTSRGVD